MPVEEILKSMDSGMPKLWVLYHQDRELARQVSEGRKREFLAFGWAPSTIPDPENHETF
jgi:maltooligosyltrehalose trehalohydrolase